MFIILSFVKIFHWLVQDRVDFIETTPNVTRLQHIRIVAFTLVLLVRPPACLRCLDCLRLQHVRIVAFTLWLLVRPLAVDWHCMFWHCIALHWHCIGIACFGWS